MQFQVLITQYFLNNNIRSVIDLGCGTGTYSIPLALQGIQVLGIDIDTKALKIFNKRVQFYQKHFNKILDITILNANVLDPDFHSRLPKHNIQGCFSMFAFNIIQPSETVIKQLTTINSDIKIAILDGNLDSISSKINKLLLNNERKKHYTDYYKNRKFPKQMQQICRKYGLNQTTYKGTMAIPKSFWFQPFFLIRLFNRWLTKLHIKLSFSYLLFASK